MAFRKRKNLTKGLHLSFSGNGVGIGYKLFPGLSISANANGLYCNTSIPGTGFYSRNKVKTWNQEETESSNTSESTQTEFLICTHIDEENPEMGYPVSTVVKYAETNEIVPDYILSNLKRLDSFKNAIQDSYRNLIQQYIDETEEVVDIYKLTANPLSEEDVKTSIEKLSPKKYRKVSFLEEEPKRESFIAELEKEAATKINSILFWTNKSKRRSYIEENIDQRYNEAHLRWESEKKTFEEKEAQNKVALEAKFLKEYEDQKEELNNILKGNSDFVVARIDALLDSIQVPVEFAINYEYNEQEGQLIMQLDLPEIENYPKRKASILANGKLSVKNKTKFEQNSEYATSVTGLAFFFAGMFFNVSTRIQKICINGYTQRIEGKTGQIEDQYIYSVIFDREQFSKLNFVNINPLEAITAFPCNINYLKSGELKRIEPQF